MKRNLATELFDWTVELLPEPTPAQVAAHLRLGVALRWVILAVVAAGAMLTPQVRSLLFILFAAYTIYNGVVMFGLSRAPARWHRTIAFVVTCLDSIGSFIFLGIYSSHVAASQPLGGYAMATIEAVGYFGAPGAILSIALFVGCVLTVDVLSLPLFGHLFNGPGSLNSALLVGTVAIVLVAVLRTRLLPTPSVSKNVTPARILDGNGMVHLTRRELDVLRLVAEGYSNTMIATRLHLSDKTVKGYVENLLTRLNVRNRAEAVAAASRLKLLE